MSDKEDISIQKTAKEFINRLSVLIRTTHIHNTNNVAVTSSIGRLESLINELIDIESSITLELRGEYFYFNDIRVPYSVDNLLNYDFLSREFRKIELGNINIQNKTGIEEIRAFVQAFIASSFSESPFEALQEKTSVIPGMGLERLKKITGDQTTDIKKTVRSTYYNAVSTAEGIMNKIRSGEQVSLKRAKRVVATMVNTVLDQENILLGMTAIKDYDEYTYYHSVNVSILAVALGHRLGLNKKSLIEVGMGGFFHDIGKTAVPNEILNKPTSFTTDEWKIMMRHPPCGARSLMKIRSLDELTMKAAIVAFEHHRNYDLTGYPEVRKPVSLDLFSRIVTIVDQYDAITSARVYSRVRVPPDKTLSIMMERAGSQLDPLIFKFFTNMVGVYPIGTLVLLNTKELGLVSENNKLILSRPRVLVIADANGNRADSHVVDLAEKNGNNGYKRSIVKSMNPKEYNINLAEFLL